MVGDAQIAETLLVESAGAPLAASVASVEAQLAVVPAKPLAVALAIPMEE